MFSFLRHYHIPKTYEENDLKKARLVFRLGLLIAVSEIIVMQALVFGPLQANPIFAIVTIFITCFGLFLQYKNLRRLKGNGH